MGKIAGFLFFGLLFLFSNRVHAQGSDWEALLYDGTQVLIVTEDGVAGTIALPEQAHDLEPAADRYVALSPDRQFFAFVTTIYSRDGFSSTLNIATLTTGDCCLTVNNPFTQAGTYIQVGPFSADNRRLFVAATRWLPEQQTYESTFLVIDAVTGAILHQANPELLWSRDNNTTLLPDWTADSIILYPTCIPCEGIIEGTAWLWNLGTGAVQPLDRYYTTLGSRLESTTEYLYAAENPAYDASNEPSPINTNVVEYVSEGRAAGEPQVVYTDSEMFVPRPLWVLDGAAYLLHTPSRAEARLVHRDGTVENIPLDGAANQMALLGTPDGWLTHDLQSGALYHYTRTADGQVQTAQIGQPVDYGYLLPVLGAPPLGASGWTAFMLPAAD